MSISINYIVNNNKMRPVETFHLCLACWSVWLQRIFIGLFADFFREISLLIHRHKKKQKTKKRQMFMAETEQKIWMVRKLWSERANERPRAQSYNIARRRRINITIKFMCLLEWNNNRTSCVCLCTGAIDGGWANGAIVRLV